jgi:hypothetical protein
MFAVPPFYLLVSTHLDQPESVTMKIDGEWRDSMDSYKMEMILVSVCGLLSQACCWYNVFRCCGCIEEEGRHHIQIEKQADPPASPDNPFVPPPPPPPVVYTPDPNPFTKT